MAKGRISPKTFRLGFSQNWNTTAKSSNFPLTTILSSHVEKLLRNKVKRFYKKKRWWDSYNRFLKILETTKSYKKALRARQIQFKQTNALSASLEVRRRVFNIPMTIAYFSNSPAKLWSIGYKKPYGSWRWDQLSRSLKDFFWWRIYTSSQNFLLSQKMSYNVKCNIFNGYNSICGSPSLWGIQLNSSGMSRKYFKGYLTIITFINLALTWRNAELLAILISRELSKTRNHYRILKIFSQMLPNFLKSKWQLTGLQIRYRGAFVNATRSKDVIYSTRKRSQKIYFQTLDKSTQFFLQPAITFRGVIAVGIWLF